MPCSNIVLLILWCISFNIGVKHSDSIDPEWMEHKRFVTMECYTCKVPQPRVFYVQDLVDPLEWREKYEGKIELIMPPATILHRCDSAGYCAHAREKCLNISMEYVNLTFAIKPDVQLNPKKGKLEYFKVPLRINHTRCACQNVG